MPRSKEQLRVSFLLLGLGLVLLVLLFSRQKRVDGFQAGQIGLAPVSISADGLLVSSSLSKISDIYFNMPDSDRDKKNIRIIDDSAKKEVWKSGMAVSKSTETKRYAILGEKSDILIQKFQKDFQNQNIGTFLQLIKKDSETSYINALSGSGIVEFSGFRVRVDTTKYYTTLNSSSSVENTTIYDPTAKRVVWTSGKTGTLTPDGTKELIIYFTSNNKYATLSEINTLLNSDTNKQGDIQLLYPVLKGEGDDNFVDARSVRYEAVNFTPLSSDSSLLTYGLIGIAVVAGTALIIVAALKFKKSSSSSNSTSNSAK